MTSCAGSAAAALGGAPRGGRGARPGRARRASGTRPEQMQQRTAAQHLWDQRLEFADASWYGEDDGGHAADAYALQQLCLPVQAAGFSPKAPPPPPAAPPTLP